ncbi:hypothetical protein [Sphingopyxis sp. FD7]|uniref:hypothetical protein n=1 Tax=Sphingopyxis sp. FD7 TaxID=1914525 RepID=UPI000DC640F8|nr:hypothetical protein [Sphingopyxis sp. FD7]BBB13614.1 hypothetical protein SPYCA_2872 [Sphingopyxis sp. FD7]
MTDLQFTDRYSALGMAPPDPATMCNGQCEGTGVYPIHKDDDSLTEAERAAWAAAEEAAPDDDGWHFIKCADCNGTGKSAAAHG